MDQATAMYHAESIMWLRRNRVGNIIVLAGNDTYGARREVAVTIAQKNPGIRVIMPEQACLMQAATQRIY